MTVGRSERLCLPDQMVEKQLLVRRAPTLTRAFLQAAGPFAVHPQLAVEVFLPELGEPNVSSVVGQ